MKRADSPGGGEVGGAGGATNFLAAGSETAAEAEATEGFVLELRAAAEAAATGAAATGVTVKANAAPGPLCQVGSSSPRLSGRESRFEALDLKGHQLRPFLRG